MAVVFSVAVTVVIAGFLWFYIVRPILEDYGIIAPRAVSYYQVDDPATVRVMSRQEEQTVKQTKQTAQTDADLWMGRVQVDRTKTALIELLVYSGWNVGEIRALLKGDSGVLGQEIDSARKRLGITPPAPHITPIANRPTRAVFEQDPELAYEPPD